MRHRLNPGHHPPGVDAHLALIRIPRTKGDLRSTSLLEQYRSTRHSLIRSGCVGLDDERYVRIPTQRGGGFRYDRSLIKRSDSTRQGERTLRINA
jgi:hypothetical protein